MRTNAEDLETAFVISGKARRLPEKQDGLLDSMSVSATVLEAVGLDGHESFKGVSAFGKGMKYVISENAGRGSADLDRKDLYFAVSSQEYKLQAVLKGYQLHVQALYDRIADPEEKTNVCAEESHQRVRSELISHLYRERKELFVRRDCRPIEVDLAS